jgi:hypothetical protein
MSTSFPCASAEEDAPQTQAAENPFAEPFDEEEIVLDPYAAFEAEMLRTAPQVINRLDRTFAGELHRCVQRAAAKPTVVAAVSEPEFEMPTSEDLRGHGTLGTVATMTMPTLRADVAATPDLLIVEDDEESVTRVVPAKQFRLLFSRLEAGAGAGREAWG